MFVTKYFKSDLIGKKFGRLIIINEIERNVNNKRQVIAECLCGNKVLKKYLLTYLITGKTKSCGCISKENNKKRAKHGLKTHKLYQVWVEMRQRCCNSNHKQYKDWGGRGIKICDEWSEFIDFYNWSLDHGWEPGLQIDRENNDGNYEPSNCRFVTQLINNQNKRLLRSVNTSGYANVYRHRSSKRYFSQISYNGEYIYKRFGFKTAKQAAITRDIFIIKNDLPHKLNFPELQLWSSL